MQKKSPRLVGICIAPSAGAKMIEVNEAHVSAGHGIDGDRYSTGSGSFNKGAQGKRQVTIMNARWFGIFSGYQFVDSRRNLFVLDFEVMDHIGHEFHIGPARLRGIKYSDPCDRPSKISGVPDFGETFEDCGGIVAEVLQGGLITVGNIITPRKKDY